GAEKTDGADGERNANRQAPANHQQHALERAEPLPFQVALALQYEPVSDAHRRPRIAGERPDASPLRAAAYLMAPIELLILSACGPRSFASLSSIGLDIFWKLDLSTPVTILTPIVLSRVVAASSSANAFFGSWMLTSRPASKTHFRWSALRLFQSLSLIQTIALLASCSVIDKTGATS